MNENHKSRLTFIYVALSAFFVIVSLRLAHLQILPNKYLEELANRQYNRISRKLPYRTPIYDRNGEELAVSTQSSSVFARPKLIKARRKTAQVLAKVFGGTKEKWLQKLDPKKSFVWIHRQMTEELEQKLQKYSLEGIFFEPEHKRIYPNGSLASNIIGLTDLDGNGVAGLELKLNQELLDDGLKFKVPKDGKGNPSYIDRRISQWEEGRTGVYLTLDRRIQSIVEEEIETVYTATGAQNVYAVVMNPHTGEIMSLAQKPNFDGNHAKTISDASVNNRVVSALYEPGSTMKIPLAADAIESGKFKRDSKIFCEDGKYKIGNNTIGEADAHHSFGTLTLEEVVRFSSNIGSAKIAQELGVERIRGMLERFGFTQRTGIGLPGETFSNLKPLDVWKPFYLATVGFGQGISVTPLQMVASFAPIANGGYLVRPKILLRDSDKKETPKKVLSYDTVSAMREIMVSVTQGPNGTGANARVEGIKVAGKTGTGQKYDPVSGYEGSKYFASFIGFLPADNPELLIGVMVDEPKGQAYYGAQVAAPLFQKIAERTIRLIGKSPKKIMASTPTRAKTEQWTSVYQAANAEIQVSEDGKWLMPDLTGLSVREVLRQVGTYFPKMNVIGKGYLKGQSPPAGSTVDSSTPVRFEFSADPG